MNWTDKKPQADHEFLVIAATYWNVVDVKIEPYWEYTFWEVRKIEDYYSLLNADGEEWGAYDDLAADKYLVIEPLK
jgi:hypothetical protein